MKEPMTAEQLLKWRGTRTRKEVCAVLNIKFETYRAYETGRRRIPDWLPTLVKAVGKKTTRRVNC